VVWNPRIFGSGFNLLSAAVVASVTHDGGRTWSTPAPISGPFIFDVGAVPVVAADGSIYVAFLSFDQEVAPQYRDHYKVVKVDPATGQPIGTPVEVGLVYDGINDYATTVDGSMSTDMASTSR
jgi:hypothetical protein